MENQAALIELKLTVEQINYILQALAHRPFGEVVQLISDIKSQGDSAIQASLPKPEPEMVEG
jgi:hypothetical protein